MLADRVQECTSFRANKAALMFSELLDEARERMEKMVYVLHDSKDVEKLRIYREKARRDNLRTAMKR